MLRKLLIILALAMSIGYAFGLTAGDIAILGLNTDTTKSFVVVALEDIPAATEISFTDNAWDATNQVWRSGEGTIVWTTGGLLPKGTIVTFTLATTFSVSEGSVTTNANFNLSTSGDQILAYLGTTAPTTNDSSLWLYGFSIESWVWANNTNTSDIPTALIGASVGLTTSTVEIDNGYFANGSTAQTSVSVGGTKAELLALFTNRTLYYTNDVGPLTFPTYTVSVGGAPVPAINATGTLTAFSTVTGTASAAQTYTLSGSNLTAGISVNAPTGYQISTDGNAYTSSLNLASSFNGLIYVRLTGASAGTFNGNITHTSTGAVQVDKAVSGTVVDPIPVINVTGSLTPFNATLGNPSTAQSYTLSGAFLTANIAVSAPTGFELSTDNSSYTPTLSLAPTFNGLVYVRLTGQTAGSFSGNITHTSTGATSVDQPASGTVVNPSVPVLLLEENFDYTLGTTAATNGWNVHSTGANPITVVEPGLTYPNYPPNSGYSVALATSGEDINRLLPSSISTGGAYAAFLINVATTQTTGDYFFHLSSNPINTSFYRGRVFLQKDPSSTNFRIGISNAGAVGTAVSTGYDYVPGNTYLVVLKYQFVDGSNNDTVHLWVNPAISGTEPAPLLTATDAITSEPANIGLVALRQGSSNAAAALKVDGIRVTNDWATLWSGEAPPTPVINVVGELDPLYNIAGSPSEEVVSYQLSGDNLVGAINIAAPQHFQVSTSSTTGWDSSIQVPSSFDGLIYVRLNSSEVGPHGGDISHNSSGADEVLLRVDGETFAPTVSWNVSSSMTAFSATEGDPAPVQSYTVSASNATGDITVSVLPGAPFEISTTGTGGWNTQLVLPNNFNASIFVRMLTANAGSFNGTIRHITADAPVEDLAVSGTVNPPAGNYAVDLFFSEYIEGSSNNKAIEIFNGTGVTVDLSDYKVELYSNGSSTVGNTVTLSGTLAHGDVFVIANSSANASILALADITSTVTFFNGDDALALKKISTDSFVDIFGMIGQDPGTAWTAAGGYSTLDKTLVRKPTVVQGITVNPSGYAANDPAAFPTLGTEWDVYPIDTITHLGAHVFSPGMPVAATPTFDPAPVIYYAPINVSISTTTPGATIRYTTDGTDPSPTVGTVYTTPIPISSTTTVKAIAYATGYTNSAIGSATYTYPILVSNIAQLRQQPLGSAIYRLTGEAVLTFKQATRNQKYVQDATGAIVIDDPSGIITTVYNLGDGITGITGILGQYSNLLQFTPIADPGAATSTGNVIVPEVRTLASLTTDDQAKLINVMNVSIDATTVNFTAVAENINATDPTATLVLRTFPATDYSNTPIPTAPVNLICLVGQFGTTMQISPRFLSDFEAAGGTLDSPVVTITNVNGTIWLNWSAITGAANYRVEHSDDPYSGYTLLGNTANTTFSTAASARKFFRVIAE